MKTLRQDIRYGLRMLVRSRGYAAGMEQMFKDLGIVRVVSIGEPKPHPTPGTGGFMVPCQLKIEKDGVKPVCEPYGPGVRPVYSQPERRNIHGGVK